MNLYTSNIGVGEFSVTGDSLENTYFTNFKGDWCYWTEEDVDKEDIPLHLEAMKLVLPKEYML